MIDEALIGGLPCAPIAAGVSGRDGALAIGHGIGGVGEIFDSWS